MPHLPRRGLLARLTSSSSRHAYLLVSLLLVIGAGPFLRELHLGPWMLEGLVHLTLFAGLFATIENRRQAALAVLLAAVAVVARALWRLEPSQARLLLYLFAALTLYANVAIVFLRSLFRESRAVTTDTVCSALSVYLLFGFVFAIGFAALELLQPGSFELPEYVTRDRAEFDRLLGFSFTTLTTLGYGNIYPKTPQAEGLANLEAILGVTYMAVVVARLVGVHIASSQRGRAE